MRDNAQCQRTAFATCLGIATSTCAGFWRSLRDYRRGARPRWGKPNVHTWCNRW